MMAIEARGFFLKAGGEPLVEERFSISEPDAGEVVVEVMGNGLCHTDLGFADGHVNPNHDFPLILGHEAVGRVVAAGPGAENLLEKPVLIPAVLPCGDCEYCASGRGNACLSQKMPGNDIHGALATHIKVPAAPLVSLEDAPEQVDLRELSVVADAVSTAFQAIRRAGLEKGELAVVIGAGGVGGFLIQIAAAMGARVIALDVDDHRLEIMRSHGAEACIQMKDKEARAIRKEVKITAAAWEISPLHTHIFECAGVPAAQQQAFALLGRGSTMVQVGFTPKKTELRLSNLMAFDATLHGTWGCPPEAYPEVLDLIYAGKVKISPFVEYRPLSEINTVLSDMRQHKLKKRVILEPARSPK
jgi:6-hydroxycyclohex-1-ene-1-carbonyl-CoA dehydrogenase